MTEARITCNSQILLNRFQVISIERRINQITKLKASILNN